MGFFKADDETLSQISFEDEVQTANAAVGSVAVLKEEADSLQRIVVSRLLKSYTKGCAERPRVSVSASVVGEKMFRIPRLMTWNAGNPDDVVEALRQGRVRARLSAVMGTGKSVKLAPYIAAQLDYRVLVVGLSANDLSSNAAYIRSSGIGRIRKRWTSRPQAWVCAMTYRDFCSHHTAASRADLYKSFDLIIFDEAFYGRDDVFVAKRCFAAFANDKVSLLLCSATISTDFAETGAESKNLGLFHEKPDKDVSSLIETNMLVTDFLTDRMAVYVPQDEMVDELVMHFQHNGVDVKLLDSASTSYDEAVVRQWLKGDSMTPRVVVFYGDYAIGANFPLEFVVLWAKRSFWSDVGGVWRQHMEPMTNSMVAQGRSRTGRGLAGESGGIVIGVERTAEAELYESDKMQAFIGLCACSIAPLRSGFWEDAYKIFPEGLQSSVACNLLKVCMPGKIGAKYLGSDGNFSSKYVRALNYFSQPDHFLLPSNDEQPVSVDDWVLDDCPLPGVDMPPLRVPVKATGEIRLMLYVISAMADGYLFNERWRPSRCYMSDLIDSDDDFGGRETITPVRRLRRLDNVDIVEEEHVKPVTKQGWSYSATINQGLPSAPRDGLQVDKARFREALAALNATLNDYAVPDVSGVPLETADPEVLAVELPTPMGQVESPGGTVVCQLPKRICEKLNLGEVLTPSEFQVLVVEVKRDVLRFVSSRLFDSFSGPWESILGSLLSPDVLRLVVTVGESTVTFKMVDCLRARFNAELMTALSRSNLYMAKWALVFKRLPTPDTMMRAIRKGKFDNIAQSDKFIARVKYLKEMIDRVLINAETQNVYLPVPISHAQRALPLRGQGVLGYVGDNLASMPGSVASAFDRHDDVSEVSGLTYGGSSILSTTDRLRSRFERTRNR